MQMAVWIAAVVPVFELALWESGPGKRRVPPMPFLTAFVWMCVGFVALPWLD